jgi:hypothetical protein
MKSDIKSDLDKGAEFGRHFLKAFLHPSPPLQRGNSLRIVDFMILKMPILSISKMRL